MKKIEGIVGPELRNDSIQLDLPACVVFKTEDDVNEFKAFMSAVVQAANDNALDLIANYVLKQNTSMMELVQKLGAK